MGSCITLLYPTSRLSGGESWHFQRPQRHTSCWEVHQGTKWNLSWTSDYQITDLSSALPGKGQHLPLFPADKECVTGRSIIQLTKQLDNNRTDRTQRLDWRQWNKSAFLWTFFPYSTAWWVLLLLFYCYFSFHQMRLMVILNSTAN